MALFDWNHNGKKILWMIILNITFIKKSGKNRSAEK